MKRILYLAVLLLFLTTTFVSCKKDKADVPVPVDGLTAYTGKNRAKVEFTVPPGAKTGKVFYGIGNFEEFTVSDPNAVQNVVVEGLPEEEQILRVVTINGDGTSSDPRGIKLKVYGAKYEATLKPRKWANQVTNSATSIELEFFEAIATEVGVWVVYTNTAGAMDSVMMNSTATSIEINNIDTSKASYYYSAYKPYTEAIDAFNSPSLGLKEALSLNFAKGNWVITGVSSEEAGKGAANSIDNDSSTAWHSETGSSFPHWISVDMGSSKLIDGFYYVNDQSGAKAVRELRFEVSDDNTTWTNVLEADVADSYLRQRLPLGKTVTARYFKVTVLSSWDITATKAQIGEIDAYNIQNVSAENGNDTYTNATPITLVNAKAPFTGDGSDLFSPVGAGRMQKLVGWTHNTSAYVTYDATQPASITLFTAAVWGLSQVTNGKVYQSVDLQPGKYSLKIQVGKADGPVDAHGLVTTSASLPDYTAVPADAGTIKYLDLVDNQNKTVETVFELTTAATVKVGFVYNVLEQYSTKGIPWSTFSIKGFDLIKVQ